MERIKTFIKKFPFFGKGKNQPPESNEPEALFFDPANKSYYFLGISSQDTKSLTSPKGSVSRIVQMSARD
jgi:hypothetical protein